MREPRMPVNTTLTDSTKRTTKTGKAKTTDIFIRRNSLNHIKINLPIDAHKKYNIALLKKVLSIKTIIQKHREKRERKKKCNYCTQKLI